MYKALSLSGTWEMAYSNEKYLSNEIPADIRLEVIKNAVPGYWEDMMEQFRYTVMWSKFRINPLYGVQEYPIAGDFPDMALPNIEGNFFYKRTFECDDIKSPATVYFGGVQNAVSLWINGKYLGRHEGYSAEFEFEIPNDLLKKGENEIFMSISNHRLEGYDGEPVVGLTSRAANECTGGITGDLEIRFYQSALRDVYLYVAEDCSKIDATVIATESTDVKWEVYDGSTLITSGAAKDKFEFATVDFEKWSPENPKLYTLKLISGKSVLTRAFGVRRLLPDGVHMKLNGHPYYLRGVCEHGYFPLTVHPDHDRDFYRNNIKKMKEVGFNFMRFHTFVPEEEYLQAADELGMLVQVECPNNTTVEHWAEIVNACRRHTSVVIYCCGNELMLDDPFIEHLRKCSVVVHENTDSLFSPMSAMRGVEYMVRGFSELDEKKIVDTPFEHYPPRIDTVSKFCDIYNSYANGKFSYFSPTADPVQSDEWSKVYNKPRLSHEICIDGTYIDVSLKDRYEGTRIGASRFYSSIEEHLKKKGVFHKAPTYYRNSAEWQRRMRKYCFEQLRRSDNVAGYDFLGPVDTHWHTFGYSVGMMNEFYELKPSETVKNVLMYNSETVVLTDIEKNVNLISGSEFSFNVYTSYYGQKDLIDATLNVRIMSDGKIIDKQIAQISEIKRGKVSKIYNFKTVLPKTLDAKELKLYITLEGDELFAENEWELYLFPKAETVDYGNLVVAEGMTKEELISALSEGKDVVLFGTKPFVGGKTTWRIACAGACGGNVATVIADHPLMEKIPNKGFCGYQFESMVEGGSAVCFDCEDVPFDPIVEMVSSHKNVIKQALMFEFKALSGRVLACGFNLPEGNPCAEWLKAKTIEYAKSDEFNPKHSIDEKQLNSLLSIAPIKGMAYRNFAFNENDITAVRRKK